MTEEQNRLITTNLGNKSFFLSLDLIPKRGNEFIYVGMKLSELKIFLSFFRQNEDYKFEKGWFCFYVIFMESISIRVNVDTDSQHAFVDEVIFYNQYIGVIAGLAIGTEMGKVLTSIDNLYAEEYYLVVGKNPVSDLIIYLDNNETDIWDFKQIESNRITKFRFYIPKNKWID